MNNSPEVVAALSVLYQRYETALISHDVATLTDLFWDGKQAVRFGATENLFGGSAIRQFRQQCPGADLAREILRQEVVGLGADCGAVTVEFCRMVNGISKLGRQSHMWYRFPDLGWKIVSSHVSFLPGSPA